MKPQVRDIIDMKLHNRATVWNLIFSMRPVSRAELAKITDMSPTTITRIVGELAALGLLVEKDTTRKGLGRKATMLDIDRDAFFTVGVNIDVDLLQTCILDFDNMPRSILERRFKGRAPSPEKMAADAYRMYREMLSTTGIPEERVRAVGLSICGIIDRETGDVVVSRQLHWRNVAARAIFERAFGLPASADNDVKAAVVEEYTRREECRAATVAYFAVSSGVGAALMCDGSVVRGANNAAGIITHVVVEPGGAPCDCGLRGCLYTCLSEKAILERIRALSGCPSAGMERWIKARRRGEAWAAELGAEVAGHVATALNLLFCSYNPEVVIVGGRLFSEQPDLLELALAQKGRIYDTLREGVRILPSLSDNHDSVVGAAIVAKTDCLDKLIHEKF